MVLNINSSYLYTNLNAGMSFESASQLLDKKEEKRKRDRERYAQMSDQEKQEKLKNVVKPINRKGQVKIQHINKKLIKKSRKN